MEKKKAGPDSTSFSPSPLRKSTAVAREDIFSPYSQAKLNTFRKALKQDRGISFSWKENGEARTFGFAGKENERQDQDEDALMLPKDLTGDRDKDMKPLFLRLVALIGESFFSFSFFSSFGSHPFFLFADRSSMRIHMKEILRGADIGYPIQSRQLKKTSSIKSAYAELRELLQAHGKRQVLKGGVLRVTPVMLDVFL